VTEEEIQNPKASDNEAVLQQQYLRAMGSFEGIILSQMEVKNKLGDRLNYSIRAGLVILSLVALSILVLLIMLSSQINRISGVVADMNSHFMSVSARMEDIKSSVVAMETQVALMADIEQYTTVMNHEMHFITTNTDAMEKSVAAIEDQFGDIRHQIKDISTSIGFMNSEVQVINYQMHRMAEPARTLNKFFPIP